ncbi:MAG TPA: alpha/beta hydrolase [Tepidisphaeraceae bacterium]|nr:alpha/beta hydrolase [Tepidisphaeraceae bacterium]
MSPLFILSAWLRGLIAVGLIALAVYAGREAYQRSLVIRDEPRTVNGQEVRQPVQRFEFRPGLNVPTALLATTVLIAFWQLGGGLWVSRLVLAKRRSAAASDAGDKAGQRGAPSDLTHRRRAWREHRQIHQPDGTQTCIQIDSAAGNDAPTLVFAHGWGADATEWNPIRARLSGQFRLIAYDAAGLGDTSRTPDRAYTLPRLADHLLGVLRETLPAGRRAVLIGHSIGSMTILEFARRHPAEFAARVAGVCLAHGTYTNPLRTMKGHSILTKIQKPLIEPLLYATIALSPLLWALNWLSYLNGSAHRSAHRSGFSGGETRDQLDFVAWYYTQASPAVTARGTLGMLHWDAADALPLVTRPALIVAGGRDTTTLPDASRHMNAVIAGSTLHELSPAKHFGLIEFDATFTDRLSEFAGAALGDAATAPAPVPPRDRPASAYPPGAQDARDRAGDGKLTPEGTPDRFRSDVRGDDA